jgi:pimeloyl-ACP methyl ester carboxylesterase
MVRPVVVTYLGSGPEVLLVHGGASPETTWAALKPLSARWRLAVLYRRGYPPSPPPEERIDWEIDATDVLGLLGSRPHVVAHSYGGVAAAIAAAQRPDGVRSLTLIEPALFRGAAHDPEIAWFKRLGDQVLRDGLDGDRAALGRFMEIAGGQPVEDGPPSAELARVVERMKQTRPPSEADPPLEMIRDAGIPVLVASGDHTPAAERMCDFIAQVLDAQRLVAPGAGHFVQAAPEFAQPFERFLRAVQPR